MSSLQSVGFRVNAHWAVHCQATFSALLFPLQPPSPFLHEWTEKPFSPLTLQCASAALQRASSAASFPAAASLRGQLKAASPQPAWLQADQKTTPLARGCWRVQAGEEGKEKGLGTTLPPPTLPGEGAVGRAKPSTFNSCRLPAAPGEPVSLVCKAQGRGREQK